MKFLLMAAVLAMAGTVVCRAQGMPEARGQAPLQGQAQAPAEWPKSIITANGTVIDLYQPQVLSYSDNVVKSRSVISVMDDGGEEPVFGVAWTSATVSADAASGQLEIRSVHVDELRIPDDTIRRDNAFISLAMEMYMPWVVKSIPEKEVQQSLELGRREAVLAQDSEGVAPVKILYATMPTALVLIDGEPRLERNERWGLDAVVNTRNVIVKGTDGNFYLYGGNRWYLARAATGPYAALNARWKPGRELRLVEADLKKAARKDDLQIDRSAGQVEDILVRTEPALLIQSDGQPTSNDIEGTSIAYVGNSRDNIFYDWNTRLYYVLIGNQWYESAKFADSLGWSTVKQSRLPIDLLLAMNGPVTTNLALTATREKAENTVGRAALLDEEVPQVAKIDRKSTTTIDYNGAPRFKLIPGTGLEYATNTCSIVINDHGTCYALDNGVWFVAGSPLGLWRVSDVRPAGVELIPLRYPAYRAKFVYIYQTAPEYVYEGYLPGYEAGPLDGCALAASYDNDWMDEAWGYDLDFVFGWGGGWYNGYFRFDKGNRYYGFVKYEGKRVRWHEKSAGGGGGSRGGYAGGGGIVRNGGNVRSGGNVRNGGNVRSGGNVRNGGIARSGFVASGGSRGGYTGSSGGSRGFTGGGGGSSRSYSGGGSSGGGGGGGGAAHVSTGGGSAGSSGGGGGGAHH